MDTGISVGYLNRIERGFITEIRNSVKRKKLEDYIKKLEIKTKKDGILSVNPVGIMKKKRSLKSK